MHVRPVASMTSDRTFSVCPRNLQTFVADRVSQSRTTCSGPPDATSVPASSIATQYSESLAPVTSSGSMRASEGACTAVAFPHVRSQRKSCPPSPADASSDVEGAHASAMT